MNLSKTWFPVDLLNWQPSYKQQSGLVQSGVICIRNAPCKAVCLADNNRDQLTIQWKQIYTLASKSPPAWSGNHGKYTLHQKKCTLISSRYLGEPRSLTLTLTLTLGAFLGLSKIWFLPSLRILGAKMIWIWCICIYGVTEYSSFLLPTCHLSQISIFFGRVLL